MPPRLRIEPWEWWLPYAGWLLCIAGWSLTLLERDGIVELRERALSPLATWFLGIGASAIILQLMYGILRRSPVSIAAVLYAGFVSGLGLVLTATFLPSAETPSQLQQSLRRLLERRSAVGEALFHGIRITHKTNKFGWEDDEPSRVATVRYGFVGDSFLEVNSSRNLARRVEDILRQDDIDVDVLNLSISDTDPSEYRHRFYEVALTEAPSQILMFLYTGNDYSLDYKYEPYRHPTFWLTPQAVKFGGQLSPTLAGELQSLSDAGIKFYSREGFVNRLHASPGDASLVYLAALAYSHPPPYNFSIVEKVSKVLRFGAVAATELAEKVSKKLREMKLAERLSPVGLAAELNTRWRCSA